MRVLLVEDDQAMSDLLIRVLRDESYAVDHAADGQEAEWLAFENPYDLIILDIMIPRKDGLSVLKAIRQGGIVTPVMLLTARDGTDDIVRGLDLGADDYATKPVAIEELLARARALIRRKDKITSASLEAGPIVINPARREVLIEGKVVDLTVKEYALLEYFVRNAGTVLGRTQLSEHVWDMNFEPTSNVVDVYVGYLRSKIQLAIGHKLIKTVRGHGYMLDINNSLPSGEMENEAMNVP
ncbi:MAG: response regulator transcription factor [Pseudomonadota bacterium]